MVLVELAEFRLAGRQAGDLRAQRLRAHHVQLRIPPHLVALHAQIPVRKKKQKKNDVEISAFAYCGQRLLAALKCKEELLIYEKKRTP